MRLAFTVACLSLAACVASSAGGRYDASQNRTFYESRPIALGQPVGGGNLGGAVISLRAKASCLGERCAPGTYEVSLSKEGGTDTVTDYNTISFETSQGTISFGGTDGDSAQFYSTAQGEFVRMTVPADIFESFAETRRLTIRLGGSAYTLSYDRRAGLRGLLPSQG